jgi:hypothetical protein
MPLAHPGVCVLAQNLLIIRLDLTFFFPYAAETLSPVLPVHSTLYVYLSVSPYLFPLVFTVSVVIPTSCCFFMSAIPSSSTHDAYVDRTMTYDHATSSWRSTIPY